MDPYSTCKIPSEFKTQEVLSDPNICSIPLFLIFSANLPLLRVTAECHGWTLVFAKAN